MTKNVSLALGFLLVGGTAWAQQYLITTVAGGGQPPTGVPAVSASLMPTCGVAADGLGNVYFSAGDIVFKVDGAGVLARVAGTGSSGYRGDGNAAVSAELQQPCGVAVDAAGNLYIADKGNDVIRKVATTGVITTVAGDPLATVLGDGGPALRASLSAPYWVALDTGGALYIADSGHERIRKVGTDGIITTVAGDGTYGYSGDGGPATSAQLAFPQGVALDGAGRLYIADDLNHVVRKVFHGIITTVAGNGTDGYSGDGGPATSAQIGDPYGVAVDAAGNLYIAGLGGQAVRKVSPDGTISTVAGNGAMGYSGDGGPATSAKLAAPYGVVADAAGDLYIADHLNNVIRKVSPDGTITTAAGTGPHGYSGDGGPATNALLNQPGGVAVDAAGNFYVADLGHNAIRKVWANGVITTVAGTGEPGDSGDGGPATSALLNQPQGVARDAAGNLFIADNGNYRVRKVNPNGVISTVAGNGTQGYSGDSGPATSAQLVGPRSVALDAAGNLYIVDYRGCPESGGLCGVSVIRKVLTNGTITTVAGNGTQGYSGDGGRATSAQLNAFGDVAVDAAGNLYIADAGNGRVRKIAVNGTITTVAGNGAGSCSPSTAIGLVTPVGVVVGAAGNLYVGDGGSNLIRQVAPDGTITTVAGTCTAGYSGDGGPAASAQLNSPGSLARDGTGNLYVADAGNNVIRLLAPQGTRALLSVAVTHSGIVALGQAGATYSVVVSNAAGAGSTSGAVTVTEIVPIGLTLFSMSGTGWNCSANTCTRSDVLNAGSSYPPITVMLNVAADAPSLVINQASVVGGGSVAASGGDTTYIFALPTAPVLISPANAASGIVVAPVLSWNASTWATSYDVYFGASSTPPFVGNTPATTYIPGTLNQGTTYYWQIVARNDVGLANSATRSFTTGAVPVGLRFVPVAPCRVADTRGADGPFAGPTMAAGSTRSFTIPQSACGIPGTALAYSLNVTAVPEGPLSYLTLWPAGQPRPVVSTLNSWGGTVVANAAIVPAGSSGAVNVYVTGPTDVILDINGYFASDGGTSSYSFYRATPCRVADTRGATGTFGGPPMFGGQTRDFPIPLSSCGIPPAAAAYSLNVTVVPDPNVGFLGYLTAWPAGHARPNVSTLNSWNGAVVANAALVPSGNNESISIFVTDPTDVILDANGYFAAPGSPGALSFYPVTPCRVADTRNITGPFGGPIMQVGETRSFVIPAGACNIPATAAAYSLNVTVVPDGPLPYLTVWPAGSAQPNVSTLNSWDGEVVANAAIVPAGGTGAVSIFVANRTHVVLDIDGYFAP
jgi:sugar lactone lactonase YvrE